MDVSKLGWATLLHRDIHNCFNRSSFQLVFTIHKNALVGTIKRLCPPNVDGAKRSKSSKAISLSWRRSTGDEWKLFLCHYWPMTTPLLFLRQFLNPSKVEEYLQLVEKTQGVEFSSCRQREIRFASWCLVYVDNETFLCLCANVMSVIKTWHVPTMVWKITLHF